MHQQCMKACAIVSALCHSYDTNLYALYDNSHLHCPTACMCTAWLYMWIVQIMHLHCATSCICIARHHASALHDIMHLHCTTSCICIARQHAYAKIIHFTTTCICIVRQHTDALHDNMHLHLHDNMHLVIFISLLFYMQFVQMHSCSRLLCITGVRRHRRQCYELFAYSCDNARDEVSNTVRSCFTTDVA